jgi:hypothetical protein
MKTAVGIFADRASAERAVGQLLRLGFTHDRITLLTPGMSATSDALPTTEGEAPGIGSAIGATVGTAVGGAAGLTGAALATVMVPGVGPVIAAGLLGAALLGVAGAKVGEAIENSLIEGVPRDEALLYADAVRRGRSVVVAISEDEKQIEAARAALRGAGAQSLDAAREEWWQDMRAAERERYTAAGGDFAADESGYRRGFEAALRCDARVTTYDEAQAQLRRMAPDAYERDAFRRGFDRGLAYRETLRAMRGREAA